MSDELYNNYAETVEKFYANRANDIGDLPKTLIVDGVQVTISLTKPGDTPGHALHYGILLGFIAINAKTKKTITHFMLTECADEPFEEIPTAVFDAIRETVEAVKWNFPVEPLEDVLS